MKNVFFTVALLMVATLFANAQVKTPAASPSAKMTETVGMTEIGIDYSRPSMKERQIFGGLVPYGEMWRTGANARTKISFNKDVTFGGTAVKAGTYAIFTKPSASSWEVYLYAEPNAGGTPKELDDSKVVAKVTSQVVEMPMSVETFTIIVNDLTDTGANFGMLWDTTYVPVTIGVGAK